MYLLDTDILSNLVKKIPSSLLLEKLKQIPEDLVVTTAINKGHRDKPKPRAQRGGKRGDPTESSRGVKRRGDLNRGMMRSLAALGTTQRVGSPRLLREAS